MMLDFQPGHLLRTTHFDQEIRMLADRHYSRRTPGARQFCYSGRKLVLRDASAQILWVWMWPDPEMRMDDQDGYNNAIFRNESGRLSSDIILEAEQHAIAKWGPRRMYTYIDGAKVRSTNPGYCYLKAGWHAHGYSKGGKRLLVKYDGCGRERECDEGNANGAARNGCSASSGNQSPSSTSGSAANAAVTSPEPSICGGRIALLAGTA